MSVDIDSHLRNDSVFVYHSIPVMDSAGQPTAFWEEGNDEKQKQTVRYIYRKIMEGKERQISQDTEIKI